MCFIAGPSGSRCSNCNDHTSSSPHYIPFVDAKNNALCPVMLADSIGNIVDIPTTQELVTECGHARSTQQVDTRVWDNALATQYATFENKVTYKFVHRIATEACLVADAVARRASLRSQTTSPPVNPPTDATQTAPTMMAMDSDDSDA